MQLKFYLVLQGPDDELVIWKRPEYENYIKGAVGVGAGSAYKLITHFDPGESLINEYVTLPPLPVKSDDDLWDEVCEVFKDYVYDNGEYDFGPAIMLLRMRGYAITKTIKP